MPRVPSAHTEPWEAKTFSFRQGGHTTSVTTLPDRVAVKWAPRERQRVERLLSGVGLTKAVDEAQLFVLELHNPEGRPAAWRRLRELLDQGLIEWASPLVLDATSGLEQIITDEITVRLKPGVSLERWLDSGSRKGLVLARRNEFVPSQCVLKVGQSFGLEPLVRVTGLDADADVQFATPNFLSEISR
jgi:hypothetical protein